MAGIIQLMSLLIPWYGYALLGALFVAVSSILEKKVLAHHEPMHLSGSVAVVGGVLSLPLLLLVDWATITPPLLGLIYCISLLSAVAFCITAYAMRKLDAGELSPILALVPAATAVFASLALGEYLTLQDAAGLFVVVGGLMMLELPALVALRRKALKKKAGALMLAFLAVFVYAVSSVLDRVVLGIGNVRALDFIVLTQTGTLITFIVYDLVRHKKDRFLMSSLTREPGKVAAIAALLFLSRIFHAQAISMAYVALASALKRSGAIFTVLLAGTILKEKGTMHKLAALLVILGGVLLIIF